MNAAMRIMNVRMGAVTLLTMTLLITLMGALGVVWMRQQITRSADKIKYYEMELQEIDRKKAFVDTRIAKAHSPENLIQRLGNRLVAPKSRQVVWVNETFRGDSNVLEQDLPTAPSKAVAKLDQVLIDAVKARAKEVGLGTIH